MVSSELDCRRNDKAISAKMWFPLLHAVVVWWLTSRFLHSSDNIISPLLLAPRPLLLLLQLELRQFPPMECAVPLLAPPALALPLVTAALSTTTADLL